MRKILITVGILLLSLTVLFTMRVLYTNYTWKGFLVSCGIGQNEIKLNLSTSYATYYLYEKDNSNQIGILSVIRTSGRYKLLNHFQNVVDSNIGTVEAFGRTVENGDIVNYAVWGGVVMNPLEEKPFRIKLGDITMTPQITQHVEGKTYFLHADE